MLFKPLFDRLVVKPDQDETFARAEALGLDLSAAVSRPKPQKGIVLAKGPGREDDRGKVHHVPVDVMQTILFPPFAGHEVVIEGNAYLILNAGDVLGVIVPDTIDPDAHDDVAALGDYDDDFEDVPDIDEQRAYLPVDPRYRALVESFADTGQPMYVRWWNRLYGPGPVKNVTDDGFVIDDNGDGWKFCSWGGFVEATLDHQAITSDAETWRQHFPDSADDTDGKVQHHPV